MTLYTLHNTKRHDIATQVIDMERQPEAYVFFLSKLVNAGKIQSHFIQ